LLGQNGIYDQLTTEAKIFRSGAGVGTSFSPLRSKYEILSGGGVSSGCLSFLKIFDRSADSVKSGGINRRSAKMIVLDINHPEIEEFIDWKYKEEQKVASLITGSKNNKRILKTFAKLYDEHRDINHPEIQRVLIEAKKYNIEINYIYRTMAMVEQGREIDFIELDNDFNNEAYHTVSGQNGNNSIAITDDFLQAVKLNKQWNLTARTTGETIKTVNAKDLWDKIAEAAWACADPGIQFKDTINAWNTAKTDGEIVASNPCSEYFFLNSTSCNLASLRLTKYYNFNNKEFDVKKFVHSVKLLALALEATVNAAILPTEELAMGSYKYRNLGIGYCDIGSLIMSCGYPYDSKEARGLIGGITALMTGITYQTSIEMASELGPFSRYEANKEHLLRVIRNHRAAVYNDFDAYDGLNTDIYGLNSDYVDKNIMNACKRIWDNVLENGEKYGFRNAHVTVLQPTGTSGLQLDADTTGIEPDFSLIKYKKLAGSGFFKIINSSVNRALNSLGYSEEQIKEVIHYILGHNELKNAPFINTQQLIEKGFTKEIIAKIENNLKATTNIQYAFNKFTIGEDFCIDELGIDEEILSHPDFSILHYLGFSDDEIEEANKYTCGMQTIEGAPYVKEEHYDVFDCASRCGPYGTRYIKHRAHIKAVASAQPFLSGSISKTINLPREATIQDVQECYDFAHSIGVKCMALYRDGSKLSQPLSSGGKADDYADLILNTDILDEFSDSLLNQENLLKNIMYEPVRRRLPERRIGYTDEFVIDSHKFYLRTSEYPVNGDPVDKSKLLGEIFIDYGEEAPFARTALGLVARFASIGLQYGVPLEEYVEALCGIIQEPRGLVKHQNVKMGKSIFDVIGKILDYRYLENSDAVEVTDEELLESGGIIAMDIHNLISQHSENIPESITEKHVAKLVSDKKREKKERLVLENCPRCGSMNVIQKSSCTKECRDCGHKHGSCGD